MKGQVETAGIVPVYFEHLMSDLRCSILVKELSGVRLECRKCHASASFPPDGWKQVAPTCINCGEVLVTQGSLEYGAIDRFRVALQKLLEAAEVAGCSFEVSLEFDARRFSGAA